MPEPRALHRWLAHGWYDRSPRLWLKPFAVAFAAATWARRMAYRCGLLPAGHPGVPVIVIGNLTVGGTGKTPLVIWLAQGLQAQGCRVGVVLRGYGGSTRGPALVTAASDPAEVGDEAVLIARRAGCQVAIAAQRAAAAALLVAQGCDVVLSDDGLQHLALRRDLEIAVVDGSRGLGNGALLPQGPLREGPRRLHSVAAVVLNGADRTGLAGSLAAPLHMTLAANELRAVADDRERPLAMLREDAVHAVAGIGNPGRFFALLRDLGGRPIEHAFADHHRYLPGDLAFADQRQIVMTEKDAVKCRAFATDRMWYLPVSAVLPDDDAGRLLRLVQGCVSKGGRQRA